MKSKSNRVDSVATDDIQDCFAALRLSYRLTEIKIWNPGTVIAGVLFV